MPTHSVVVVDASALVELLIQRTRAAAVEAAVGESEIAAPEFIHAETLSALRGLERGGELTRDEVASAYGGLLSAPIETVPSQTLLHAAWLLREGIAMYDAFYVALAQQLGCPLITADLRLARARPQGVALITV